MRKWNESIATLEVENRQLKADLEKVHRIKRDVRLYLQEKRLDSIEQ
jgi:hypothetical protein